MGEKGRTTSIISIALFAFLILPVMNLTASNSNNNIIPSPQESPIDNKVTGFPTGWSDDIRLSFNTNPDTSIFPRNYSALPKIATNGNFVHVIWTSLEVTKYFNVSFGITNNVTYIRSVDNGQTWTKPVFLSNMTTGEWNDTHTAWMPKIVVNGSTVHVVWAELIGGTDTCRIRYRRSLDNGDSWEPPVNITPYAHGVDTGLIWHPDIAVWNENVHIVWDQIVVWPDLELYYINSSDNGATWNTPQRLTNDNANDDREPIIAVNDTNVHVVWDKNLIDPGIMYMKSIDGGISWQAEKLLSEDDGWFSFPTCLAIANSSIYIGFLDDKHIAEGGKRQAYFFNSSDNGESFYPEHGKKLSNSDIYNTTAIESMTLDNNKIHVTLSENRDGYLTEVYYIGSSDIGQTWSPDLRLTYTLNSSSGNSNIAIENNFIHVIFQDNRTGDSPHSSEIYYKRYPDFPLPDPIYNINLNEGWNLISTPLSPREESLIKVLENITGKWDVVKYYDTLDKADPWKTYRPGSTVNDLTNIDETMGFWIYINQPNVTLTVSGVIPASTTIPLYAGWNLVGYPTQTTQTVGNALWGTGADRVEVFDPASPYIKEIGPTYIMKPGEGYWIHVPADTIWVINW
jgi:hypothetical protein